MQPIHQSYKITKRSIVYLIVVMIVIVIVVMKMILKMIAMVVPEGKKGTAEQSPKKNGERSPRFSISS